MTCRIDAYIDDVGVVLDATGSDRALIVASGERAHFWRACSRPPTPHGRRDWS